MFYSCCLPWLLGDCFIVSVFVAHHFVRFSSFLFLFCYLFLFLRIILALIPTHFSEKYLRLVTLKLKIPFKVLKLKLTLNFFKLNTVHTPLTEQAILKVSTSITVSRTVMVLALL